MSKVKFEGNDLEDTKYADTAAKLVNDAINDAIHQLERTFADEFGFTLLDSASVKEKLEELALEKDTEIDRSKTPLLIDADQQPKDISNIEWMTIDKFGKEVAESKIDEFIKKVRLLFHFRLLSSVL